MRITDTLNQLKQNNRKALSLFVTAGYPTIESTVQLIVALAKAGADVIELGIPFSDPIADGPTIQFSSEVALRNGVTLQKTLALAEQIRKQSDIPLILMGYANPFYAYGIDRFLSRCKEIGIDGTIIADLPLEESEEYRTLAKQRNIDTIFLAAPTTPPERLTQLDKVTTGFLYCVSITGVTGERKALASQTENFLKQARASVKNNPLLVGFGISTPEDARRNANLSDGIIIGSALVNVLSTSSNYHMVENAVAYIKTIRQALDTRN